MRIASRWFSIKSIATWLVFLLALISIGLIDLAVLGAGFNLLSWSNWDTSLLSVVLVLGIVGLILSYIVQQFLRHSNKTGT